MNHEEYLSLVREVNRLRTEIHLFSNESIDESVLDELKHKITEYEKTHPTKIAKDSPNAHVAGGVLEGFEKFPHARRVLSLGDIFSLAELREWEDKYKDAIFAKKNEREIRDFIVDKKITIEDNISKTEQKKSFRNALSTKYICEPKLDGMALILHYDKGALQRAVTRGDSYVGEVVTENIRTIPSIPHTIRLQEPVEIRGELIMTRKDFSELNEQIRAGKKRGKMGKTGPTAVLANPRNAVAGSIRNLDQSVARERTLVFIAYGLYKQKK